MDARDFISRIEYLGAGILIYADPPYLVQGESLYLDALTLEDHLGLASQLRACRCPWLLTYDTDKRIVEKLYQDLRAAEFDIAHTAQKQHVGSEFLVFSPNLEVPRLDVLGETYARWVSQ